MDILYSLSTCLQGSHETYLTYPEDDPDTYIELKVSKKTPHKNRIEMHIKYSLNKYTQVYHLDFNENYIIDNLYEQIILDIIKNRLTGG